VITSDRNNGYEVAPATKLAYGVGALSDSIKTLSFTMFLLFYYTTVLGLSGTLLALAMAVGLVWDAAVDPLIGHVSDHLKVAFGRRHSFMLVGTVCAGASFIAVFNPPSGLSTGPLFAWLMVTSFCLRTSNSLFMVPYYALGAELTQNYHERTSISGYRVGTVLAGTLLTIGAAFLVFLPNNAATGMDAKFAPEGYASMGVAFGVVMIAAGLVATFGTLHERPRLPSSSSGPGRRLDLRRTLLSTLSDRSFRVLVFSSALFAMATAINAALGMHFLTYHARIEASQGFTLFFVALYVGAIAGVFVWVRVTKWIEKSHVYAATTLVTALVISSGYWLVGEGRPFGTGHSSVVIVVNALAGFFGAATAVLVPSMMADVTAHDEVHTGRRRDGVFFGIYSFGQQFSSGLAVLIAGVLVDHFAGLVPAQAAQSAATVERLAMISNLLPAVILAGAGVIALRYRLTRQELQQVHGEPASAPLPHPGP
jgi:Na+/melibiose symporter-like transporter